MNSPDVPSRLLELVQRWSDGSIADPEVRELEALLRSHPDGPRIFAELTHLDQSLRALGPQLGADFDPVPAPTPRTRLTGPEILAVVALALLAIAVLGVLFPVRRAPQSPPSTPAAALAALPAAEPEAPFEPCATLTHSIGAKWAGPSAPIREGENLPPGALRLESGLAHVQFLSGARLVLEGPAELTGHSFNSVICRSGRFFASIPRHTGAFALVTPRGVVTDTGSEIGLQIDVEGRTEIHLFRGQVVVRTPDVSELAHLGEGQATVLGEARDLRLFAADLTRFVTPSQLVEWHALRREQALNDWYLASLNWRRDPRLLAFFDFDAADPLRGTIPAVGSASAFSESLPSADAQGGEETNRLAAPVRGEPGAPVVALDGSPADPKHRLEAVLIGAQQVDGRWPGKVGYALSDPRERIRVQLSGHHDALTLLMWVRPAAALDRSYSLLVSDGFDFGAAQWRRHGAVQWCIHGRTGQLSLRTRRHAGEDAVYLASLPAPEPLQIGRWIQLACVYDRLQNRVAHYVNGKIAGSNPLKVNVRLEIGVAEIGNAATLTGQPTYFPGVIDELSIYQAALPESEIRALYNLGKPD